MKDIKEQKKMLLWPGVYGASVLTCWTLTEYSPPPFMITFLRPPTIILEWAAPLHFCAGICWMFLGVVKNTLKVNLGGKGGWFDLFWIVCIVNNMFIGGHNIVSHKLSLWGLKLVLGGPHDKLCHEKLERGSALLCFVRTKSVWQLVSWTLLEELLGCWRRVKTANK